jgi:hypothetical protein
VGKKVFLFGAKKSHSAIAKDTTIAADNAMTFLATALLAPVFKGRVQFAILHANFISTLGYLKQHF